MDKIATMLEKVQTPGKEIADAIKVMNLERVNFNFNKFFNCAGREGMPEFCSK